MQNTRKGKKGRGKRPQSSEVASSDYGRYQAGAQEKRQSMIQSILEESDGNEDEYD